MDGWMAMDWWNLAPYWVPAIIGVVALVVLASAARSRAIKRSRLHRSAQPSSSVDSFYLDSSHMGEPRTEERTGSYDAFGSGRRSAHKRHARRIRPTA